MKLLTILVACIVTTCASSAAMAGTSDAGASTSEARLEVEMALAPVKNPEDLAIYLARYGEDSPLGQMSPMNRERFLQSLSFGDRGLAWFDYASLDDLNPVQIYRVLGILGVQALVADALQRGDANVNATGLLAPSLAPIKGYRCGGGHTCIVDDTAACTSNC